MPSVGAEYRSRLCRGGEHLNARVKHTPGRAATVVVICVTIVTIFANVVDAIRIDDVGKPIRRSSAGSVMDLAAERTSLVEQFGLYYQLRSSGLDTLRAPERLFSPDVIDGLADARLVEGATQANTEAAAGPSLRGTVLLGDRTFQYLIRPSTARQRHVTVVGDVLLIDEPPGS